MNFGMMFRNAMIFVPIFLKLRLVWVKFLFEIEFLSEFIIADYFSIEFVVLLLELDPYPETRDSS